MKKLTQDTEVKFEYQTIKGEGKIVGISMELPVLGYMYLIQTDSKISDIYPYTTFSCPASYVTEK